MNLFKRSFFFEKNYPHLSASRLCFYSHTNHKENKIASTEHLTFNRCSQETVTLLNAFSFSRETCWLFLYLHFHHGASIHFYVRKTIRDCLLKTSFCAVHWLPAYIKKFLKGTDALFLFVFHAEKVDF